MRKIANVLLVLQCGLLFGKMVTGDLMPWSIVLLPIWGSALAVGIFWMLVILTVLYDIAEGDEDE